MVSCERLNEFSVLRSDSLPDGEGYVEDGREIFDEADEYEAQENSNKRKSLQKKRGSKLPDEPVAKKKSLKNFFNNQEKKEKDSTSVEDDNLLKNMLFELDSSPASTSQIGPLVAPLPRKSIRKQATDKEIEMKNYMEKFGKKAQESKSKIVDKSDVSFDLSRRYFAQ